ncbi:MAG: GTP-binding protein [Rhodobacter sp.]|nr:GTP-binding protein [Rhodobacter sp.]
MSRLPLTVVGGYLGSGKTTLINRLLAVDHGLRLAVLVNDFGAINIDAALLKSAREDTIELTNGCVCCSMAGNLYYAIGDMLDRSPRPDHLIVEASGIADPAKIAELALSEPEMAYAGILTVIDGINYPVQLANPRISSQLRGQASAADLLVVSKTPPDDPAVTAALGDCGSDPRVGADDAATVAGLVLGRTLTREAPAESRAKHPGYVQWSSTSPPELTRTEIEALLSRLPSGVLRLKALIADPSGGMWEVHVVGEQREITQRVKSGCAAVAAIGLEGAEMVDAIEDWWNSTV